MGYMMPTLLLFITIGTILTLTGVMLSVIAFFYRTREAIIRALGILLLGLAMLTAFNFQNLVLEELYVFGYDHDAIKSLDIPKINAIKGAPTGITTGVWQDYSHYIILTQLLLFLALVLIGYLGVEILGLEGGKRYALTGILVIVPAIGFILSYLSLNSIINGNVDAGVRYRDLSNIVRIIASLLSLGVVGLGLFKLYKDLGEKAYLAQSVGWILLLLGLLVMGYISSTSWERAAIEHIQEGDLAPIINMFRLVSLLLLLGSMAILAGSLLELVPAGAETMEEEEAPE